MTDLSTRARRTLGEYQAGRRVASGARGALWSRLQASIAEGGDERFAAELAATGRPKRTVAILAATIAAAAVVLFALRWAVDQTYPVEETTPSAAPYEVEPVQVPGAVDPSDEAAPAGAAAAPNAGDEGLEGQRDDAPAVVEAASADVPPAAAPTGTRRRASPNAEQRKAATKPATTTKPLAEELRLVQQAKAAIDSGSAKRALRILREHARRFPSGQLTEDRRALRAVALCGAGKLVQGRAEAATFLRLHPRSHHQGRVKAACK